MKYRKAIQSQLKKSVIERNINPELIAIIDGLNIEDISPTLLAIVKKHGYTTGRINVEYDYDYTAINLVAQRPETDEEWKKRVARITVEEEKRMAQKKVAKNKKVAEDKALYLKLKKRFG